MKNKCTLIVDGNWLLISRLSMCKQSFDVNASDEDKKLAKDELCDIMTRTINVTLCKLESAIDNVIFVADGYSWRKLLDKPSSRTDIAYKGNRQREVTLDWEAIFDAMKLEMESLASNNCTVTRCDNTEGDDLIYYWSKRLNSEGINTVIWSTDNDLKQLIRHNDNDTFTAWYNDSNGLFLHNSYDTSSLDSIDFFMMYENPSLTILKQSVHRVSYINPDEIVMAKIVCGDSSDNIKSLIIQKRGNKNYRITEKVWAQVQNELGIRNTEEFYEHRDDIIKRLCEIKSVDYDAERDNITEIFDYNRQLVHLHEDSYPEYVKEQMKTIGEYKQFDIDYIINNYKAIDISYEDNEIMETFLKI